jgi:glutamate--cysteine ligase
MKEKDLPFFRLAMTYSEQWADHFRNRHLSPEIQAQYEEESRRSLEAQREVEEADNMSFKDYLEKYFAQYRAL